MKRILVIKLGALGDVVMATPLIDAIMQHHANDAVSLVTTPAFAPLFTPWPGLSIHATPRHGLRNMVALLGWIRRQRFSRIYDLQSNDRSGLLCALSAVEERVGNHCRFPYSHHPDSPWRGQSHIFERLCAVLASADIEVATHVPLLPPTAAIVATVRAWIARHALEPRQFVLLHGGASPLRADKRWPRFDELAQRLRAAGMRIVWLGAEPERQLNATLARTPDIDATNAFDILGLAELGRLAHFAVTNDSGPMHVLAASAIPVFGLFGPSDWRRNHALGQRARVIACVDHVAAYAGRRAGACLPALQVDVVWNKLVDAGLV
ncbi:MAG: glycosyltransferase family 9 protein [Gammaproteobacteria bacterium]